MNISWFWLPLLFAAISASCTFVDAKANAQTKSNPSWMAIAKRFHQSLNVSVNPCENFYEFACGGWKRDNPVPEGRSEVSLILDYYINMITETKKAVDTIQHSDPTVPAAVKQAKILFDVCVMGNRSGEGAKLKTLLDSYGGWPMITQGWTNSSIWSVSALMGHVMSHYAIGRTFLRASYLKELGADINFLSLSGTREFLPINKDELVMMAKRISAEIGVTPPSDADLMRDAEETAQVQQLLNQLYLQNSQAFILANSSLLQEAFPFIHWQSYFTELARDMFDMSAVSKVWVDGGYIHAVGSHWAAISDRVKYNYIMYRLVHSYYLHLESSTPFLAKENAKEILAAVQGPQSLLPEEDWETEAIDPELRKILLCFRVPNLFAAPGLSRLYVDKVYPDWSMAEPLLANMFEDVRSAAHGNLNSVPWLDAGSKASVLRKLSNINVKLGFSKWILDNNRLNAAQAGLHVMPSDNQFETNIAINKFVPWMSFHLIGTNSDGVFLQVKPMDINAFYQNLLVKLPAGILNKPIYDPSNPLAVSYGTSAFVMGHEIGHGFDNDNVLTMDLGQAARESFNNLISKCIVKQYNGYCMTLHNQTKCVNGDISEPDNIADSFGLAAAYRAYRNRMSSSGGEQRLPGSMSQYSMEQVFFISVAANFWCRRGNEKYFNSPWNFRAHAPGDFRIIGAISNTPGFAQAWNCPVGSNEAPRSHCHIWN